MEGGSGPRSGVHNKQMFIIGGFTISDPDCMPTFDDGAILDINSRQREHLKAIQGRKLIFFKET